MKKIKELFEKNQKEKVIACIAIFLALVAVSLCIALSILKSNAAKLDDGDTSEGVHSNESTDKAYPKDSPKSLKFTHVGEDSCVIEGIGEFSGEELEIPDESPDGDTVIGIATEAFSGCTALVSVNIPGTVRSIGEKAFYGCENLAMISVSRENQSYCSLGGILYSKDKTLLVCYPAARVGSYYLINQNVNTIADYAFYGAKNLQKLYYEDSPAEFGKIKLGRGNERFSSLPITCNYISQK